MAGLLLAAFPVLLLFNTRLAWVALAAAICLLVSKRLGTARAAPRRSADRDASI